MKLAFPRNEDRLEDIQMLELLTGLLTQGEPIPRRSSHPTVLVPFFSIFFVTFKSGDEGSKV